MYERVAVVSHCASELCRSGGDDCMCVCRSESVYVCVFMCLYVHVYVCVNERVTVRFLIVPVNCAEVGVMI